MYRAGILIAIFAIAALTLAPEPSLAQSLTQQAERPASGRASANTAAASRGRPDDLASRGRPLKWGAPSGIKSEKPHGYESEKPHGYESGKPGRPEKPTKPHGYKPHKPDRPHKPEPPWCEPEAYCESDKDCHAMYPCKHTECETSRKYRDKTWPKKGKCVCEGNKDGPCAPSTSFPPTRNACDSIGPDIGLCAAGECKPIPRDEGCPCDKSCLKSDDPAKTVCDETNSGACNPCIDTDVPCTCKDGGSCEINYLSRGIVCDATDAGITLGVCEIAKCSGYSGECIAANLELGTGCFLGNSVQCDNAGTCGPAPAAAIASSGGKYVCNLIGCDPEEPVEGCNDRPNRGSLGQPCKSSGEVPFEGICCVDRDSVDDPKPLQCVVDADHCPCLPDSENPECPADQVCCDEGTPLGNPDGFVCKGGGTCGAIPCSAQKCGLKGSETNLEFAFAYCSPGCGKDKAGCIDSCDTCSSGGAVTNNCNNVNSGIEGTGEEQGNSYCSSLKKKLGYDVSNCCICKISDPVGQAGCIAPTS